MSRHMATVGVKGLKYNTKCSSSSFLLDCRGAGHYPHPSWSLASSTLCFARRPYNLYRVGGDVKPCSISQSTLCSVSAIIFSCYCLVN